MGMLLRLGILLSAAGLANCGRAVQPAPGSSTATAEPDVMIITGEAGYRERILPPPGAVGVVTLSDVSQADAPSVPLATARYELSGRSVPFPYRLTVPPGSMQTAGRYAVRVIIQDAKGALLWTTDRIVLADPTRAEQRLDLILMVRVARGPGAGRTP